MSCHSQSHWIPTYRRLLQMGARQVLLGLSLTKSWSFMPWMLWDIPMTSEISILDRFSYKTHLHPFAHISCVYPRVHHGTSMLWPIIWIVETCWNLHITTSPYQSQPPSPGCHVSNQLQGLPPLCCSFAGADGTAVEDDICGATEQQLLAGKKGNQKCLENGWHFCRWWVYFAWTRS